MNGDRDEAFVSLTDAARELGLDRDDVIGLGPKIPPPGRQTIGGPNYGNFREMGFTRRTVDEIKEAMEGLDISTFMKGFQGEELGSPLDSEGDE